MFFLLPMLATTRKLRAEHGVDSDATGVMNDMDVTLSTLMDIAQRYEVVDGELAAKKGSAIQTSTVVLPRLPNMGLQLIEMARGQGCGLVLVGAVSGHALERGIQTGDALLTVRSEGIRDQLGGKNYREFIIALQDSFERTGGDLTFEVGRLIDSDKAVEARTAIPLEVQQGGGFRICDC